ncbi:hypothetical protein [Streptomyces bluensis]|uniref:hypothetical protein n=1 Tax=Streptomyces bluensis TaxID=33897 RepID=UPI00332A3D34
MSGRAPASGAVRVGGRARPALCRGLVLVDAPGGLVLEGGPHRMLLSGEAASGFLRALLPLLDGRHGPDELCALLAVEPADLTQALELLDDWGVLESGSTAREEQDEHPEENVPEQTVTYYSRTAALTGGHASGASVLDELSRSHVLLVADEPLTRMLAEDLTAGGVGRVSTGGGAGVGREVPQDCDLVVVADRPGAPGCLEDWVATAWADGVPVLRFATGDGAVEVGPLFWPGESACVGCFRRGGGAVGAEGVEGGARALSASAAAMEVLAVLARTTPVTTLGARVGTTTAGGRTEHHLFAPHPACDICGDSSGGDSQDGGVDGAVRLIEAYEWRLALPPGRLLPAPRLLAPRRQRMRQASRRRVTLHTSPGGRLPERPGPRSPRRRDGHPGADDPVTALSALLPHTAGTTVAYGADRGPDGTDGPDGAHGAGRTDRADGMDRADENSPVPVNAYVLTDLPCLDLPGQVFLYDEAGHRLLSVRADSPPWRPAVLSSGPDVACLDAVIVLVADAGPLAAEFGDGARRLAHLDAGIAAMRLASAARELRIPLSFELGWSDRLEAVLELDPTRESVAAVAGLLGGPGTEEVRG